MKTIKITIPRKGISEGKTHVTIEAEGYTGTSCQSATEKFKAALGALQEEEIKPEMYATEDGVERLREGEGGL
jgi:hypothetical protein